jgi:hypothetical protein
MLYVKSQSTTLMKERVSKEVERVKKKKEKKSKESY